MKKKSVSVLLLFLVVLLCVCPAYSDLAGWWKLDEGSGFVAYDSSGGNHNGTIGSGQSWNDQGSLDFIGYTSSHTENSITFSSSDANSIFESVDSKMMVSFWVKLYEPLELSKAYHCTMNGEMVSYVEFHPALGGVLRYKPNKETDCFVFNIFDPNSENYIDISVWNHFLFVRDLENNTIEIYLNGNSLDFEIKIDNPPYASFSGIDDFIIGGYNGEGHFKGSIKDFRVYNDSARCCIDIDVQPAAGGPYVIRSGQQLTFDGNDCFTDGSYGYGTSWYVDDYLAGEGGGMCIQGDCSESSKVSVTFDELVNAVGYGVHDVRLDMISYNPNMECDCEKSDTTTIIVAPDADFQYDGNVDFADFAIFALAWQTVDFIPAMHLKLDETTGTTLADESPSNNYGTSGKDVSLMQPMVGHWKMNDNEGQKVVLDNSPNGNNGVAFNNIISVAGKVNSAISFNGVTDYVDCGDIGASEGNSALTLSVWFYPTSASDGTILGKNGPYYVSMGANLRTQFAVYAGGTTKAWTPIFSTDMVDLNAWNHVVCTYDGVNLKMYLNGVYQGYAAHAYGGNTFPTSDTLKIGYMPYGSYFTGNIDDVRVYNKVLSESELDDIYMNGLGTESEAWNKGAIDGSLFFNGVDDYIGCGAESSIANIFDGGGTLACWVDVEGAGINGDGTVADKNDGWRLFVNGNNTTMCFSSVFSENPGSWQFSVPSTGWVHIVIAYDDDSVDNAPVVYVDGSEVAITETATPIGTKTDDSSQILYIGNNKYYADAVRMQPFNGYIDDVRLYSEALTPEQIYYSAFDPAYDIGQPQDGMVDWKDLSVFADFWLTGN